MFKSITVVKRCDRSVQSVSLVIVQVTRSSTLTTLTAVASTRLRHRRLASSKHLLLHPLLWQRHQQQQDQEVLIAAYTGSRSVWRRITRRYARRNGSIARARSVWCRLVRTRWRRAGHCRQTGLYHCWRRTRQKPASLLTRSLTRCCNRSASCHFS